MLADRQEFNMRESYVARVSRQFLRQLAVAEPTAAMLPMPAPRSEMDFIDRYRRAQCVDTGRCRLRPLDHALINHHRSRLRPQLGSECHWIRLQLQHAPLPPHDLIFFFL